MSETKNEKKTEKIEKQRKEIIRLKQELKNLQRETKRQTATLITSALGFIAALFWREAIQAFLQQVLNIKAGEGWWIAQFFVAVFVTFLAVIALYLITKSLKVK
jgi:sterol desaturase/sphingolipid hydroxylase (fatty acid hydroxylase superfamily)